MPPCRPAMLVRDDATGRYAVPARAGPRRRVRRASGDGALRAAPPRGGGAGAHPTGRRRRFDRAITGTGRRPDAVANCLVWAQRADDQARAVLAFDDAARFRRGSRCQRARAGGARRRRARGLLVRLAEAQFLANRVRRQHRGPATRRPSAPETAGRPDLLAARRSSSTASATRTRTGRSRALCERALARATGPDEHVTRARLLAQIAIGVAESRGRPRARLSWRGRGARRGRAFGRSGRDPRGHRGPAPVDHGAAHRRANGWSSGGARSNSGAASTADRGAVGASVARRCRLPARQPRRGRARAGRDRTSGPRARFGARALALTTATARCAHMLVGDLDAARADERRRPACSAGAMGDLEAEGMYYAFQVQMCWLCADSNEVAAGMGPR